MNLLGNFTYIESLCSEMKYLFVPMQTTLAHSKFDIELCWEIKKDEISKRVLFHTTLYNSNLQTQDPR